MINIGDQLYFLDSVNGIDIIKTFKVIRNVNSGNGEREFILRNGNDEFPCKEKNINNFCTDPKDCEKIFKRNPHTEKEIEYFEQSLYYTLEEHKKFLEKRNDSSFGLSIAEMI